MSTRTAKVFTYQEDVESADLNKYPQGWLARVRVTGTNQTGISSEAILTAFTETATAQGTDRSLLCRAVVQVETGTGTGGTDIYGIVRIRSGSIGGTIIAYSSATIRDDVNTTTIVAEGCDFSVNGSVSYYVTLEVAGVDTLDTVHSTNKPGELLVMDIGPT